MPTQESVHEELIRKTAERLYERVVKEGRPYHEVMMRLHDEMEASKRLTTAQELSFDTDVGKMFVELKKQNRRSTRRPRSIPKYSRGDLAAGAEVEDRRESA